MNVKTDNFKTILLWPIILVFIFLSGVYVLTISGIIGGYLLIPMAFFVSSFHLLYSISYFIHNRKNENLDIFFVDTIVEKYRKNHCFLFRTSVVLILILLVSPMVLIGSNYFIGDKEKEIQNIVIDITEGCNNETSKLNAILKWFNRNDNGPENFSNMYYRKRVDKNVLLHFNIPSIIECFYFTELPYVGVRFEPLNNNIPWIITTRCGMCGETGILFTEMAKSAGLNVSTVYCTPEDHVWNEVYIDGDKEPIIVDATAVKLPNATGIKSQDFMQQKVAGNWGRYNEYPKEGNISFVYAKFPNDSDKYNITDRYTGVVDITVNVTDSDEKPASNVSVKVISYNRPDVIRRSCWGLEKITNEKGQVTFSLGGGRYKFELQREGDILPRETDIGWFWEYKEHQYVNAEYKANTIIDVIVENLIKNITIIFAVIILFFIGVFAIFLYKRRLLQMKITKIEDLYIIKKLKFHYTRYNYLDNILQHGILSLNEMEEKGISYEYDTRIAQKDWGRDKISIVDFDGKKTSREIELEKMNKMEVHRPPKDRGHELNMHAFREDVTLVLRPDIKTIPKGYFIYEHLVKNYIPRYKILAVCYNKEIIEREYESKSKDVIKTIGDVCKKHDIMLLPHDTREFRKRYYRE